MMIDIESIFASLASELSSNQKKLSIDSSIGVYYGLSEEGNLRLSFLSTTPAPKMESTKLLKVTQGWESQGVYWTCFDLLQYDAQKVFYAFCQSMIDTVVNIFDEKIAINAIKKRYIVWKTMFKHDNSSKLSREVLQGLFGELYFLKNHLLAITNANTAIQAWSGPDSKSKDFALGEEWFEIKTVGANASAIHISSLAQLSSSHPGHLVIIRVESMSTEFDSGESSIGDLFKFILSKLDDETTEGVFLSKVSSYGFSFDDVSYQQKFDVKSMQLYKVDDEFPRITENDISRTEICDVSYSLIINALKNYRED